MNARIVYLFPLLLLLGLLGSCDLLVTADSRQEEIETAGSGYVLEIALLVGQSTTVRLDDYPDFGFVSAEYDSSIVVVDNLQEAMIITLLSEIDESYEIGFVAIDHNGQTLMGTVRLLVFEDLEQDFEIQLALGAWGTITLLEEYPDFGFVSAEYDNSIVFVQFLSYVLDVQLWDDIEEPYVFNYQATNSSNGQKLSGRITVIPSQ